MFTDADLKANREGYLSRAQTRSLRMYSIKYGFNALVFLVVACLSTFWGISIIMSNFSTISSIYFIGIGLVFGFLGFRYSIIFWRFYSENKQTNIAHVDGNLLIEEAIKTRRVIWINIMFWLMIPGYRYPVSYTCTFWIIRMGCIVSTILLKHNR